MGNNTDSYSDHGIYIADQGVGVKVDGKQGGLHDGLIGGDGNGFFDDYDTGFGLY